MIPDRVFGLEFTGSDGQPTRAFYFLEADRATMPVKRQTLVQSSFYRKLLAYEATWTQNIHRARLGFNRFRVLTGLSQLGVGFRRFWRRDGRISEERAGFGPG